MAKSKKKLNTILGAAGGCLLLVCCGAVGGGSVYYWYWVRAAAMDLGDVEDGLPTDLTDADLFAEVAWGEVKLSADPTNVYASNDKSSGVVETRARGETVEYYGFDSGGGYFKVKTTGGEFGYIRTGDAEMEVHLGEVRVVADSARVYSANSTGSGVLEVREKGEKLDWYGYDGTGDYYKVHTVSGADGYIRVTDATIQ